MRVGVLSASRVEEWVSILRKSYRVWAPVPKDGEFVFAETLDGVSVSLDYRPTLLPPKSVFLPPRERLAKIQMATGEYTNDGTASRPRAIVGVHSCDIHGLRRLDLAMREAPADGPYVRARGDALIVGLACAVKCSEVSFCDSMETYAASDLADVMLTPIAGAYWAEARNDAERWMSEWPMFEWPTAKQEKQYEEARNRITQTFRSRRLHLRTLGADMKRAYADTAYWEKLAERCFSCGACTAVCPTCVCFDIQDEIQNGCREAERCRRWDSCLLRDFAVVAGGENFRPKRFQRLRHRMMRRSAYLGGRFELPAFCVGCGRCASVCLGKISPLEAFEHAQKGAAKHDTRSAA